MKIMSMNLNGIRSARQKHFFKWLETQDIDVICLQETRAQVDQLTDEVFYPPNYHHYFASAEKKGYAGVAIYSKIKPKQVITSIGCDWIDSEGRYIQLDFEHVSIVSIYFPSGTSGDERQDLKYKFLDFYFQKLKSQRKAPREYIICGDWNIAHTNLDIKNWRSNQKNSGFLPEERAWLDKVFGQIGYIDAYRYINPDKIEYTWWSHRGKAWDNNIGWRIDYQVTTPGLKDKILSTYIHREQKFSDHAPFIVEYDLCI